MSLRPEPLPPIPDTTAAAVRAAVPKGNLSVDLRTECGTRSHDQLCADLSQRADHYPHRFSKRLATRQPSTSNVKSRRPRHKVRTPGIPSL